MNKIGFGLIAMFFVLFFLPFNSAEAVCVGNETVGPCRPERINIGAAIEAARKESISTKDNCKAQYVSHPFVSPDTGLSGYYYTHCEKRDGGGATTGIAANNPFGSVSEMVVSGSVSSKQNNYTTVNTMLATLNSLVAKYAALNNALNGGRSSISSGTSGGTTGTTAGGVTGSNTGTTVNSSGCVSAPAISIGSSISLPASFRYVRKVLDGTDWVALYEMEAYDENNQKVKAVSATANRVYDGNSPFAVKTPPAVASYAIDENSYTAWNSGVNCDKKAWVQADYGAVKQFSNLRFQAQGLGTNYTTQILVSTDGQTFNPVKTFTATEDEPIEDGEWLDVKNDPRSLPKVAPTITRLVPNSGKAGTKFEIVGTGFTYRNNAIAFGPTIGHVRAYGGSNRNNVAGTSVYGMASYDMYYNFDTGVAVPLNCISVDPACVEKYRTAINLPIKPGTYNVAVKTAYGTSNTLPFTITE